MIFRVQHVGNSSTAVMQVAVQEDALAEMNEEREGLQQKAGSLAKEEAEDLEKQLEETMERLEEA